MTRRESQFPRPQIIRDAALCLAESGIALADWVLMRETLIGALIFLPDARAMVEAVEMAATIMRRR